MCVRTSVGRIWLPEASRYSLGWVSCSQLCLSACSHDVYCICQPPTQRSLPSLLRRFIWSCSPQRCTVILSLCLSCGPLALDSLGGLFSHVWGCQCVPGHSGSMFQTGLAKRPHAPVNPTGWRLHWPQFQVLCWLNGQLRVPENGYHHHSVCLQCVPLPHSLPESESNCPHLSFINLHSSGAQVAVEGFPVVTVLGHCSTSYSAVVRSRPVRPPYPDPCTYFGLSFSRPAD